MKVSFDGQLLDMQEESDADIETLQQFKSLYDEAIHLEEYFHLEIHLALEKNLVLKVEYI